MASFEKTFSLRVPSSTENLSMIRDFVSNIGVRAGLDESQVLRLALAVDEACANVIEHAYGSEHIHEVTIRGELDNEELSFVIVDTGRHFDPASLKSETVEELVKQRKSGGLGLRLIRTIMDDVQYRIIPGEKNELRMTKKLHRG
ncbi:MAG: ATP-binding protein [Bryobacteraceae bacterium]|nr:ATP-binding protein [Bryobacteraceae bacterium]